MFEDMMSGDTVVGNGALMVFRRLDGDGLALLENFHSAEEMWVSFDDEDGVWRNDANGEEVVFVGC
jgi:hypothetical protein